MSDRWDNYFLSHNLCLLCLYFFFPRPARAAIMAATCVKCSWFNLNHPNGVKRGLCAVMVHHLPLNVIQPCTEAVELTSISRNDDGTSRNLRPSACWCFKNIHEKSENQTTKPKTFCSRLQRQSEISFSRDTEKDAHKGTKELRVQSIREFRAS